MMLNGGINDILMDKQNKIMLRNRKKFDRFFGRFRNKSNKFTIQSITKSTSSSNNKDNHKLPMMDNIYKYMYETPDISFDEMNRFKEYINFEEYDTDSLFYDIEDYPNSNILSSSNNLSSIFSDTLYQFIKYKQGMYMYTYFVLFICYYFLNVHDI